MLLRLVGQRLTEQRLERFTAPQWVAEIHFVIAVQAGAKPSVCSKADPVARAAIRVSHRCNDSHRAGSSVETIVLRRPIPLRRPAVRSKYAQPGDALENLVARDDMIPRQLAKISNRHQLDRKSTRLNSSHSQISYA